MECYYTHVIYPKLLSKMIISYCRTLHIKLTLLILFFNNIYIMHIMFIIFKYLKEIFL